MIWKEEAETLKTHLAGILGDAKCCSQLTAITKEPGHPPVMTCHVQYQGLGELVELFSGPTLWVQ